MKIKRNICLIFTMLAVLLMLSTACAPASFGNMVKTGDLESENASQNGGGTALNNTQESTPADVVVETRWLDLVVPGNCAASMKHREVVEGGIAMEIFSLVNKDTETELFRIYFGDEQTGTFLGTLHENDGKIPVTLSVTEYRESDFPDDQTRELYYLAMDGMNQILDGLYNEDRFSSEEKAIVNVEEKHVAFWDFSLPVGVDYEENRDGSAYRAIFYGTVDGTRYPLYVVAVGDAPLRTVLGSYTTDGQSETVSVESFDLPDTEGWTEDSEMELYRMMETINEVIQTILESKDFSAEAA